MRVSPIGWVFDAPEETLAQAQRSAAVTHNRPEGITEGHKTAAAIWGIAWLLREWLDPAEQTKVGDHQEGFSKTEK
jgi:ADP-ribosylglycohydrolase